MIGSMKLGGHVVTWLEMIYCLNKLNFEIFGNGLKVTGKRNNEKNYIVNMVTVVTLEILKLDTPSDVTNISMANPGLRLDSTNTTMTEKSLADAHKYEYVYLAEIANSVNVNEIDMTHITDYCLKEELINLADNYKPEKTKSADLKVKIILSDEIPVTQRPRRLAFAEQAFVDKKIQERLDQGIIRESCSS